MKTCYLMTADYSGGRLDNGGSRLSDILSRLSSVRARPLKNRRHG